MTIKDIFEKRRCEFLKATAHMFSRTHGASASELLMACRLPESPLRRMLQVSVQGNELFVRGGTKSQRYFLTEAAADRFVVPPPAKTLRSRQKLPAPWH